MLSKATDFLRAYQGRDVVEDASADILEGISNTLTASTSFAKKNYHEVLHQEDGGKLNLTQTINRRRREAEQATREFYKVNPLSIHLNEFSGFPKYQSEPFLLEIPSRTGSCRASVKRKITCSG